MADGARWAHNTHPHTERVTHCRAVYGELKKCFRRSVQRSVCVCVCVESASSEHQRDPGTRTSAGSVGVARACVCVCVCVMEPEIKAAVSFLVRLLRSSGFLPDTQLQVFRDCLQQALSDRYRHHWFPDRPQKGSGYRCIRINHEMDPLLAGAASRVGLSAERLFSLLPRELTLWIDPYEVSYRIGEDGSICVLYESQPPASAPMVPSPFDPLSCKNGFLMGGRTSPPKHYLMTVSG